MSEEKKQPSIPSIIIPESTGGEYTDKMKIPIGYHKAKITKVDIVTPDDQFNSYNNYQYRLVLSFPQFAEEGKGDPGLFFNMTVLVAEKDGEGVEIPDSYKCAIFPGGTGKSCKVLEAIGIEITPGLEITPELLINKEVGVSVSPHTNKKGDKVRVAKEIISLSEIEESTPSKPVAKAEPVEKAKPVVKAEHKKEDSAPANVDDKDLYEKALKVIGDKDKLDALVKEKDARFNGLVPKEGILVMIANGE